MDSNDELVDYLKKQGRIRTAEVEEAFRNVDRADFVPGERKDQAYRDTPLPIGHEATISAPHMVAENTELLEVERDSKVVEIGSGSGHQLAILAELTEEEVTGVEVVEALVEKSREVLEPWDNVEVVHGSGLEAADSRELFDRILFSCAIDSLEDPKDRLKEGGVLLAPVEAGLGQVLKKYSDGEVTEHGRVRFVSYRDDLL